MRVRTGSCLDCGCCANQGVYCNECWSDLTGPAQPVMPVLQQDSCCSGRLLAWACDSGRGVVWLAKGAGGVVAWIHALPTGIMQGLDASLSVFICGFCYAWSVYIGLAVRLVPIDGSGVHERAPPHGCSCSGVWLGQQCCPCVSWGLGVSLVWYALVYVIGNPSRSRQHSVAGAPMCQCACKRRGCWGRVHVGQQAAAQVRLWAQLQVLCACQRPLTCIQTVAVTTATQQLTKARGSVCH